MSTDSDRRIDLLPLDDIVGADHNPREHDLPAIRASISRFGFADPPELDERTGRLVAGHGRLAALAAMRGDGETPPAGILVDDAGRWLAPVARGWSSRSDAEALAYLVSNNRQTELARWNHGGLLQLLEDVAGVDPGLLQDAGYDLEDLDRYRDLVRAPDLDAFAREIGDGDESDGWPTVKIRVDGTVAAAWTAHLDTHLGDGPAALAALLGLDPHPPTPAEWNTGQAGGDVPWDR